MNIYEITGIVKTVLPVENFNKGFSKQTLVLLDNSGKYPEEIPIEFIKDNMDQLRTVRTNADVKVKFRIKGREWNGKYYTSIVGLEITNLGEPEPEQLESESPPLNLGGPEYDPEEDVPF